MATDRGEMRGGGWQTRRRLQARCWSRVEIQTWKQFFSLIFVRIHTNEFIQLLYKLYSTNLYTVRFLYQFIQFFIRTIVRIHHTRLYHRLPRPLGYTRLPRPLALGYTRLPRHLGYAWLPRPLGYTRLPRPVRERSW